MVSAGDDRERSPKTRLARRFDGSSREVRRASRPGRRQHPARGRCQPARPGQQRANRSTGSTVLAGLTWWRLAIEPVDQGIYGHLTLRNLAVLAEERGDRAETGGFGGWSSTPARATLRPYCAAKQHRESGSSPSGTVSPTPSDSTKELSIETPPIPLRQRDVPGRDRRVRDTGDRLFYNRITVLPSAWNILDLHHFPGPRANTPCSPARSNTSSACRSRTDPARGRLGTDGGQAAARARSARLDIVLRPQGAGRS